MPSKWIKDKEERFQNMTAKDAAQLVNTLALIFAKQRSNLMEALGYKEVDFDDLSQTEQEFIKLMNPGLFGGNIPLMPWLLKLQAKGEDIQPLELYNFLFYATRDEFIYRWFAVNTPEWLVETMPKWLGGWTIPTTSKTETVSEGPSS